jgi:hypothetical protein
MQITCIFFFFCLFFLSTGPFSPMVWGAFSPGRRACCGTESTLNWRDQESLSTWRGLTCITSNHLNLAYGIFVSEILG